MADQASTDIDTPEPSNGVLASDYKADPAGAVQNDDLLGELARAMHQAATSQYERLNDDLAQRRAQQVEAISAHTDREIENLKAASESDVNAIDSWAKAETEKIKLERLRRIDDRREQLAGQLDRQETIKQRQVFAIEVAIDAHRNEVDLFFGRMEREDDPAAIARIASTMPAFPSLADIADEAGRSAAGEFASMDRSAEPLADAHAMASSLIDETPASVIVEPTTEEATTVESTNGVVEAAAVDVAVEPAPEAIDGGAPERAAASLESDPGASVSESRLMAVMDPAASAGTGENPHPWEAPYALSVAAGTGDPEVEPAPEPASRVGSTLLRTVRAIRPMSGERHERDGEDR